MKKFLISSVVASTLLSTASLAAISTTGTGEFLVAPQYFANSGFSTDLKLVNTSAKYSYIYRAVVREYESSNEFDFIVLLSPLDVWTGTISQGADGYYITSTDDSNYKNFDGFKVNMTEFTKKPVNSRTFEKGYVEFYPIAAYDEGTDESTAKPVNKQVLQDRFDKLVAKDTTNLKLVKVSKSTAFVSGFVTIKKDDFKAAMTIPMTAFNDVVKVNTVASDVVIAAATNTDPKLYLAEDGVKQVYADLKTTKVTLPYENFGVNDGAYFTFWGDYKNNQVRTYDFLVRDNKENGKEVVTDPFSGSTPDNPTYSILKEMGNVKVNKLLSAVNLNVDEKYKEGMVKLYNLKNGAQTGQKIDQSLDNPAALVTYMSARYVAGSPSFSWTYAPVER